MAESQRSRYTAVITVYLDTSQREACLVYARHEFPGATSLSPGQLIQHLFEMRGRGGLLAAWEYAEQQRNIVVTEEREPEPEEQGGEFDGEEG